VNTIFGFELVRIESDSRNKNEKLLFMHEKTKLRMLIIKNDDINRGFAIKFNTITLNNRGTNHVIEHSIMCGSKKYPCSNIITDLTNTTYTSYANAFTYQNMNVYLVCSKNEKQLKRNVDIYLDAVFRPLFISDERIFEREGYRHELLHDSKEIRYNGIVYNEMLANTRNIEYVSKCNAIKTVFKNSTQGNIAGGDPTDITKLTYQELVNTYKMFYHPTNGFMVLYGDLNYNSFMEMIDKNYLAQYTEKGINFNREISISNRNFYTCNYEFPVAKEISVKRKSIIDLTFALEDMKKLGVEKCILLDITACILNFDNSKIKEALHASGIAESYSIRMDARTFQPYPMNNPPVFHPVRSMR
jgi:Zn-dependent M16 (insulinase) family peptidase